VDGGYASVTAGYCPGGSCPYAYYAVCNGTSWFACACGSLCVDCYTMINGPSSLPPGVDGGSDTSTGPDSASADSDVSTHE
jgi:hypothetical protein